MKIIACLALVFCLSCNTTTQSDETAKASLPIQGTWKLIKGTLIEKGDTTVTDYTTGKSFIKIINDTHFAFLMHGFKDGKDSSEFSSGGGAYTLNDSAYTEHLEYCNDRQWEGNDFSFTITINNDTLTQTGIEKIDSIGVNRLNVEKYVRLKN